MVWLILVRNLCRIFWNIFMVRPSCVFLLLCICFLLFLWLLCILAGILCILFWIRLFYLCNLRLRKDMPFSSISGYASSLGSGFWFPRRLGKTFWSVLLDFIESTFCNYSLFNLRFPIPF